MSDCIWPRVYSYTFVICTDGAVMCMYPYLLLVGNFFDLSMSGHLDLWYVFMWTLCNYGYINISVFVFIILPNLFCNNSPCEVFCCKFLVLNVFHCQGPYICCNWMHHSELPWSQHLDVYPIFSVFIHIRA